MTIRVLFVDHTAKLSGGEIALGRMLTGLQGVEPMILLGEEGPFAERLRVHGFNVRVSTFALGDTKKDTITGPMAIMRGGLRTLLAVPPVHRVIREWKPDIVHVNSLKSGFYGSLAARAAGVPVVWHLRDRLARDYMPTFAIMLTRATLRVLPQAIICNSAETSRYAGHGGWKTVIPSPVIYDAHDGHLSAENGVLEARPFTVYMLGRLAPWKGQDLFIDAFAQALGDTDARACIVGSAMFGEHEYAAQLASQIERLQLTDRIQMTGFVENASNELFKADALVHASRSPEPFGQVVVEGLAAGLPVIASRAGGPAEILEDDVNGLLYAPGDTQDLARQLLRLYQDPALRERLSTAAVGRAAEFTPERTGNQVLALYRSVLAHRRVGRRSRLRWWTRRSRRAAQ